MQTGNLTKWVDELQTQLDEVKRKIASQKFDLAALSDVSVTDPVDGQALIYDDANDKFVNSTISVYKRDVLYTGEKSQIAGELTLAHDLKDYDIVIFYVEYSNAQINACVPFAADVASFIADCPYNDGATTNATGHILAMAYNSQYVRIKMGSADNKVQIFDLASVTVTKIIGLKF